MFSLVQLDHQRALKNCQAFNEAIGRRRAEFELTKTIRIARDSENRFHGQIGSLRDRILHASDELQRSVEERSIMQSKLQHSQSRIDQLTDQLREVEQSRSQLERQRSNGGELERAKRELEYEIKSMRRQLEQARESEQRLSETVNKVEGRGDQSRREIMELERELRVLRAENSMLQSKLGKGVGSTPMLSSRSSNKSTTANLAMPTVNIPVISVPSVAKASKGNSVLPLEIANESPIVRRGKRHSTTTAQVLSEPEILEHSQSQSQSHTQTSQSQGEKNNLSSLLEGVGKKKIKLPERFKASNNGTSINSFNASAIPSTPQTISDVPRSLEVPRATPLGNSVDANVMESIISSFTVKLPTNKK